MVQPYLSKHILTIVQKVKVKVTQSCPTDCPQNSLGQNTGVGSFSLLQEIFPAQGSNPGLLKADSLPVEPQEKTKNTGVGSDKLLQQIFPTQESNWGSPALKADSLPTELQIGKPYLEIEYFQI